METTELSTSKRSLNGRRSHHSGDETAGSMTVVKSYGRLFDAPSAMTAQASGHPHRSASDRAFIFFIAWPRWILTVISLSRAARHLLVKARS